MSLLTDELYHLCNQKRYFTGGTNEQYDKLFQLAGQNAPVHDIALTIWLCSSNVSLEDIEQQIEQIKEKIAPCEENTYNGFAVGDVVYFDALQEPNIYLQNPYVICEINNVEKNNPDVVYFTLKSIAITKDIYMATAKPSLVFHTMEELLENKKNQRQDFDLDMDADL